MRLSPVAAAVLLCTSAALAGPAFGPPPKPGPAVRKPANLEYSADELGNFAEAIIADKSGDLEAARDRYRRAISDSPHPATLYNLADVLRRMEAYKDAIAAYQQYLEADPEASDRAAVEAVIAALSQTPQIVTVDGEDPRALVFLDGVLVGPSPQTIALPAGWHAISSIGPDSYRHHVLQARPLQVNHLQTTERRQKDEAGNVVLAASAAVQRSGSWKDGARMWQLPHRNVLPPGRYETVVFDPKYLCSSLLFEVPPGDGTLYVYIDGGAVPDRSQCLPFTVKTKKLVFPPMIRALLVLSLVAHVAAADDAVRKGTPDKFVKAAGEAFRAAVAADKAGQLQDALGLYQKAFAISPHPSTVYNIADVQRRLGQLPQAIKSYEIYLAVSPDAADRAQVEVLLDKLVKTPGMLWVSTSPPSDPEAIDLDEAFIIVDGEIKKQPGVEIHAGPFSFREGFGIDLRAGAHVVDVVTAVSFGSATCKFGPGENRECTVRAPPRTDGSIVFNSNESAVEVVLPPKGNRRSAETKVRFVLPAGKQRLSVRDRNYECAAVPVEVPRGDLAYVFVSTTEHDRLERCRSLKVVQHKLHFAN